MARPLRISYPDAWYHVLHRGFGRRSVFTDAKDRTQFLALLDDIYDMWGLEVHAYCLMNNHYHMLVHTPQGNLSRAMRHLNGIYTQYFNRSYTASGPVFRGRFKSIIIDKDEYLLELVRYIHLNPVKTGLCDSPSKYRWSSHRYYLNPSDKPKWLMTDEVLLRFGKRYSKAIPAYKSFIQAGVSPELERRLEAGKLPSVLGPEGFVDWIKYNFIDKLKGNREIPEARGLSRRRADVGSIMTAVSEFYDISKGDMKGVRQGKQNEARDMTMYLLRHIGGVGYANIGRALGGMSTPAVAQGLRRFRTRIEGDIDLREKTDALASNILSLVKT